MQSRSSRRARGFTLVEAMVAMGLMTLLLAGTMDLFLTATRTTTRATAQVSANMDGANALQHVTSDTREALWFALPDDPSVASSLAAFTPPPGDTVAQFKTTVNGVTVDTGIQLTFPPGVPVALQHQRQQHPLNDHLRPDAERERRQ